MSIERELLEKVISGDNKGDFFVSYDLYKKIYELLAHPESTQEPEAWILEDKKTGYRRQSAYKPTDLDEEACNVIPLYTAPPKRESLTPRQGLEEYKKGYARAEIDLKREPLSDEDVFRLYEESEYLGFLAYRKGIKDAEKAHGIGGE